MESGWCSVEGSGKGPSEGEARPHTPFGPKVSTPHVDIFHGFSDDDSNLLVVRVCACQHFSGQVLEFVRVTRREPGGQRETLMIMPCIPIAWSSRVELETPSERRMTRDGGSRTRQPSPVKKVAESGSK